ncbi:MAG TPA: hypothetical protein VNJ07_11050, partial [Chitinophagales bacterium]|nr:hypothetical protein [Chitinophagales bacterium]
MPEPFAWCMEQISKSYSFTDGARHGYVLHLARYCNIKGLPEPETLSGCLQFIQDDFTEKEIRDIVRHVYEKQSDSHNKKPFTVRTHNNTQTVTPEPFEPVTFSDILDVHQMLNEIEGRGTTVPADVWADFWRIKDHRADGVAWRKLIQFISLN